MAPGGPFNRGRALAGPRALAAVAGQERSGSRSRAGAGAGAGARSGRNGAPARARSAPPAAAAAAPAAATAPPRPGQVRAGQPQLQGGERAGPSPATRPAPGDGREGRVEGAVPPPPRRPSPAVPRSCGGEWGWCWGADGRTGSVMRLRGAVGSRRDLGVMGGTLRSELGGEEGRVGRVRVWGGGWGGKRRGGAEGTALFTPRRALSSHFCSGSGEGRLDYSPGQDGLWDPRGGDMCA